MSRQLVQGRVSLILRPTSKARLHGTCSQDPFYAFLAPILVPELQRFQHARSWPTVRSCFSLNPHGLCVESQVSWLLGHLLLVADTGELISS